MTEDEARALVASRYDVPRETMALLDRFLVMLHDEAGRQNLVAASTLDRLWSRHVLDSAQLLDHAPKDARRWLDLGAGAGFPGIVIGVIAPGTVKLVESRRKRIGFLEAVIDALGLTPRLSVCGMPVERMADGDYDVITARAFAPLPKLFDLAHRFSRKDTLWLLPKGRSAQAELAAARGTWQGRFRIEESLTDPESAIIVADHVERRKSP